jgi:glutamine amidotransferase
MIALVDVCGGNLRSVERALERVGGEVVVTREADVVRRADKIVVPGQGAFGVFMRGLAERGLEAPLRDAIARGVPYLGICLGLQVLFEHSEEGDVAGLGVLRGMVTRLVPGAPELKIPHMGWNGVHARRADPLLADVGDSAHVYFVHSYRVEPADDADIVLESEHGVRFCAAVRRGALFACQFHPEKSQAVGLAILRRFVEAA